MSNTKVRRIKAKDAEVVRKKSKDPTKSGAAKKIVKKQKSERKDLPKWFMTLTTPFRAFGRYVAGAASELKQTRWPNRKATWGLTVAVIIFSVFFATLILLVDYGFEQLLELVLNI